MNLGDVDSWLIVIRPHCIALSTKIVIVMLLFDIIGRILRMAVTGPK